MNIWNVLKIEQTKDKDALKKAYRMRLSSVNPEDDAEGFMELRKAYEEALRLADIPDVTEEESDNEEEGEDSLSSSLLAIYNDFEKRINPDVWQELFNTDAFVSLDSRENSMNELLYFFINHVFIPQKVWKLIVEEFDIKEQKKELSERFPENYIEYILNNARYDDIINYDYFETTKETKPDQIDDFIRTYYDLDRIARRRETQKAKELIEQSESDTISHPYLELMKLRLALQELVAKFEQKKESMSEEEIQQTNLEELFDREYHNHLYEIYEKAEPLAEKAPNDITILHFCGDVACHLLDYEAANKYYDQAKQLAPENYFVKAKHAELMFRTGCYKESRDTYMELLKENHYDNNVRIGMIRANQKLIEENEKLLAEHPDNASARMEIAWSRYQSYQFREAIDHLTSFLPEGEQKFEYYNVLGRCYLGINDSRNALQCFLAWKNLIERLPEEDQSEEVEKKRKRYPYVHFLLGDCYLKLKQYDEARKYFQFAIEKQHDEIILCYEAFCELEYVTKNYRDCLKACETVLEKDSKDYIGYIFKAKACEKLDYLSDALHACEQAVSLYPYLPDPYALKVKIYLKADKHEQALEIIRQFDEMGMESDSIDYHRARILYSDNKIAEAVECLQKITHRSGKDNTDLEKFEEIYILLGFCYERMNAYQEEIAAFQKVISINPNHKLVHGCLGTVYRMLKQYDNAFSMYDIQIRINPTSRVYVERALLYQALGKTKQALSDFECAIQLDPSNAFAYSRLGLLCEMLGEFRKAEEAYQNALSVLSPGAKKERAEVTAYLARLLQCKNEFHESNMQYLLYINNYGLNADIAYDYSVLLMRMGDFDEAVRILKQAINMLPYDTDLQMCIRRLIEVYGEAGYIDLAHETFQYAMEKNPLDARACGIMGDIFMFYKLYDDAKEVYEKAIELDSDNKENYYSNLMECLVKRKWLHSITKYVPSATIPTESMYTPQQYIKMARLSRVMKRYREALALIDIALKKKRCRYCFYCECHEALYEKAKIYEAMREFGMACRFYKSALRICGHNAYYESCLKRIQDKK